MNREPIIQVSGLTKKYKEILAVNNLEFTVFKNDVFGFLGPNGAGKSTTIRMLLSLITPTSGEIKIFGLPLKEKRPEILARIGGIVEKPDFYMYLTAQKNLEMLGKINKVKNLKKRIGEVLEIVGLSKRADSKVKTYSHGMKQRLGIAQALLHNPELIILDEPTTGLDPQGIKEIRDLIISLSADFGKTVLLSSHILKEIEIISNRMLIINKGTSQVEGLVDQLLSSEKLIVAIQVDNLDKASLLVSNSEWKEEFKRVEKDKMLFELSKEKIPEINRFLVTNDINVFEVNPRRSLEEYFLKITEGGV